MLRLKVDGTREIKIQLPLVYDQKRSPCSDR
jgi:hypothetical protein